MEEQKKTSGCLKLYVVGTAFMMILYFVGRNKREEREAANPSEKCLSAWDGSSAALVRATKKQMNDPKSFEHVQTRYISRGGETDLIMKFRGKNAFGGVVIQTVLGTIDDNCDLIKGPTGL